MHTPAPVKVAIHWVDILIFCLAMLGLVILGQLVISQVIGILRSPDEAPNGVGQMLGHLWPWVVSTISVLGGGVLAIVNFWKHRHPFAWVLVGVAYAIPFFALTLS